MSEDLSRDVSKDLDPAETQEWLDALDSVLEFEGAGPGRFLLTSCSRRRGARARRCRTRANTPYLNTIPPDQETAAPRRPRASSTGSARSSAGTRWRSCCAPTRSPPSWAATSPASSRRRRSTTSASSTSGTRRPTSHGGDLVYIQGHSSPGIYARAFLEGRLTEEQLLKLPPGGRRRRPVVLPAPVADAGLLAVPDRLDGARAAHGDLPGALPEVPATTAASPTPPNRKVWAFLGDGEMDEPESLGAHLAGRPREARQPDLRHQLQPAAPRRAGARQRQDHPGAGGRSSAAPAGTSSR